VSVLNMQLPTTLMSDVADDLYSARQQLRVTTSLSRHPYRGLLFGLQRSKRARTSGLSRYPVVLRSSAKGQN
jgi:hypothetical protein